jgi:hypothetical protein
VRALALLVVLAGLAVPASALGAVTLTEGPPATGATTLVAAPTEASILEQVDGTDVPVPDPRVPWTCRTSRTYVAVAGAERSAPLTVQTPACAARLRIASVHSVGLGGNLRVTLLDRWEQGGFTTTVCARPPHRHRRCEPITMGPGQYVVHAVFRTTRVGAWRVTVRDPWHAVTLPAITVRKQRRDSRPAVLFTGDSMMLAPQQVLAERLHASARTIDDVYVGSGISSPQVIDWAKLPRSQVRAYRPDATVLTLGMDDSGDLPSPAGPIRCCGDDFIAAYAQRARAIMRTYLRGGRGAVVWLNVPLARDPRRWPSENAVDTAVALAASGLERVRIVDQAALLTPNGYEEYRTVGDRAFRLRTDDGIHLTKYAASLVSAPVLTALSRDLGVVATR